MVNQLSTKNSIETILQSEEQVDRVLNRLKPCPGKPTPIKLSFSMRKITRKIMAINGNISIPEPFGEKYKVSTN